MNAKLSAICAVVLILTCMSGVTDEAPAVDATVAENSVTPEQELKGLEKKRRELSKALSENGRAAQKARDMAVKNTPELKAIYDQIQELNKKLSEAVKADPAYVESMGRKDALFAELSGVLKRIQELKKASEEDAAQ